MPVFELNDILRRAEAKNLKFSQSKCLKSFEIVLAILWQRHFYNYWKNNY